MYIYIYTYIYIYIDPILSTSKMLIIPYDLPLKCWPSPCQQSPMPLPRRTTVCEMLVSGGVGHIDEIVKEEAAIMKRRQLRDRLGGCDGVVSV